MLEPVVIPNAFSPNGDGVNDRWEIKNLSVYPGATVEIFDRGGHLVYSVMNGYSTPWDGSRSGKPLPVGVYYYIINLKNGFSAKTGYVTILR
jgi:gliding motility-associated-like protein